MPLNHRLMNTLIQSPLDRQIGFSLKGIRTTEICNEKTLRDYLKKLKSKRLKKITEKFRLTDDPIEKKEIKEVKLRYIMPNGTFHKRRKTDLIKRSGIIGLDIDKLEDVDSVFEQIKQLNETIIVHRTVSGKGLRSFVSVNIEDGSHEEYYNALINYYRTEHNIELDKACRDISRAFVINYDDEAYSNEQAVEFDKHFIKKWGTLRKSHKGIEKIKKESQKVSIDIFECEKEKLANEFISKAEKEIEEARDGEKHNVLFRQSIKLGTLIAYEIMDSEEILLILTTAIEKRSNELKSLDDAYKTIRKGVDNGISNPIDLTDYIVEKNKRFWFLSEAKEPTLKISNCQL